MAGTTPQQDRKFSELLAEVIYVNDASFIIEWVASEFAPEDVFTQSRLEDWAEQNGYVLEE